MYTFQRLPEVSLPWYAPLVPLPLGVWLLTPALDLLVRGAGSQPAA